MITLITSRLELISINSLYKHLCQPDSHKAPNVFKDYTKQVFKERPPTQGHKLPVFFFVVEILYID